MRRGAVVFAVVLTACFILGIMFVGLGGQVLYPLEGTNGLVKPNTQVESYDRILVVVLQEQLPALMGNPGVVLGTVVLVAIMAASMSTADSNLHALSAVTVRDLYDRYVRPGGSERERVWVGRLVIVSATITSLYFVVQGERAFRTNPETPYKFMEMIADLGLMAIAFSAQLLPITIDMLFLRRGTRIGAACGLTSGLIAAFVFSGKLFTPFVDITQNNMPEYATPLVQINAWTTTAQDAFPIHESAWGLLFNIPIFCLISLLTSKVPQQRRAEFAAMMEGR